MTDEQTTPLALVATDAPERRVKSRYPQPFAARMGSRIKRPLGDLFGLNNFGVNLTTLQPGGESALMHRHSTQDEFVYVLEGTLFLRTDRGEIELKPGMCAGFVAGGVAHHLVNRSQSPATYLEIGDRSPGDRAEYPEDDLEATLMDGVWIFTHKDGRAY